MSSKAVPCGKSLIISNFSCQLEMKLWIPWSKDPSMPTLKKNFPMLRFHLSDADILLTTGDFSSQGDQHPMSWYSPKLSLKCVEFVNHTWLPRHSIANQHKLLVKVSQEWCLLQLSPRSSWSTASPSPQSTLLSTLLPKLPQQPIKLWAVDEISSPKSQNPPEPSSKTVQTHKSYMVRFTVATFLLTWYQFLF